MRVAKRGAEDEDDDGFEEWTALPNGTFTRVFHPELRGVGLESLSITRHPHAPNRAASSSTRRTSLERPPPPPQLPMVGSRNSSGGSSGLVSAEYGSDSEDDSRADPHAMPPAPPPGLDIATEQDGERRPELQGVSRPKRPKVT